jgi:putative oxidoreductase
MKKLISVQNVPQSIDISILILRIAIAALMLTHGLPKLTMLLSGDPVQFPPVLGLTPEISLGLAVFAEVFCSILILVGFGTRLATIPLIITMLVAIFFIHSADPFAKQEMGLHYLLAYVLLLISGSGKYSVDNYIHQKQLTASYAYNKA